MIAVMGPPVIRKENTYLLIKSRIMNKINFEIIINAPRQKVWDVLWGETSYPEWTSVFSEGSHIITDYKKGSKVLFLDGKGQGMVSRIAEHIPPEYMSFEHLGFVKDGIEDTESEEVKKWSGSHENYKLDEVNGKTRLQVDMDITEDFKDYFQNTWPKAMVRIRDLSEN